MNSRCDNALEFLCQVMVDMTPAERKYMIKNAFCEFCKECGQINYAEAIYCTCGDKND